MRGSPRAYVPVILFDMGEDKMDISYVKDILERVAAQDLSAEEAYEQLRDLPYEELGYANIDEHRALRTGQGEVIFGQGKTPDQIAGIAACMAQRNARILVTRAAPEAYTAVAEVLAQAVYHESARIITVGDLPGEEDRGDCGGTQADPGDVVRSADGKKPLIAVVTAGTSDIPVAEEAALTAEFFGAQVDRVFDVGVAGIHRLFDKMDRIRSADVVIVIAGMEGALASVVGGLVEAPVIAVPTSVGYGASFGGLSALLSMLNSCANGIGVVNIDNGYGAACLAVKICKK